MLSRSRGRASEKKEILELIEVIMEWWLGCIIMSFNLMLVTHVCKELGYFSGIIFLISINVSWDEASFTLSQYWLKLLSDIYFSFCVKLSMDAILCRDAFNFLKNIHNSCKLFSLLTGWQCWKPWWERWADESWKRGKCDVYWIELSPIIVCFPIVQKQINHFF